MRRELLMPKLGLTMTEGLLVEWMVAPGQHYQAGDSLFVIESEKAAIEVPADAPGQLLEQGLLPGQTAAVGAVMGWYDDGQLGDFSASPAAQVTQAAAALPGSPATVAAPAAAALPAPEAVKRIIATPLARRLAAQRGIDLAFVQGSGPRGRIRAADLPDAAATQPHAPVQPLQQRAPAGVSSHALSPQGLLRPPTKVEQTIAERLVQSKQSIPHFYLQTEVELSALLSLRTALNAAQAVQRFTVNDFLMAAVGRALRTHPELNRVWTEEGILSLQDSDVGMAVHTERGLMAPVLRSVGQQGLGELARSARDAIARARAGRLSASDLSGGAITVSNAGMHQLSSMVSIINPGQSMILGVGSVRELFRPDPHGQPQLRREISLSLSADHRVLDGVSAARMLGAICAQLAQPLALLVNP